MSKAHQDKTGVLNPIEQLQKKPAEFLIVGIAAAEGGTEALQEFFKKVPKDSDLAYLVMVLHTTEDATSLSDVLQKISKVPVLTVTEKNTIHPNHIYLIPSDQHLIIGPEFIAVSSTIHMAERRAPIDIFFRVLADKHGPRAVSVILSGGAT